MCIILIDIRYDNDMPTTLTVGKKTHYYMSVQKPAVYTVSPTYECPEEKTSPRIERVISYYLLLFECTYLFHGLKSEEIHIIHLHDRYDKAAPRMVGMSVSLIPD